MKKNVKLDYKDFAIKLTRIKAQIKILTIELDRMEAEEEKESLKATFNETINEFNKILMKGKRRDLRKHIDSIPKLQSKELEDRLSFLNG